HVIFGILGAATFLATFKPVITSAIAAFGGFSNNPIATWLAIHAWRIAIHKSRILFHNRAIITHIAAATGLCAALPVVLCVPAAVISMHPVIYIWCALAVLSNGHPLHVIYLAFTAYFATNITTWKGSAGVKRRNTVKLTAIENYAQ